MNKGDQMSRKTVVVGVDGSAASNEALHEAVGYARLLDADLRMVTTWNYEAYAEVAGSFDPEQNAREIAAGAMEAEFGTGVPAWVTVITSRGDAGSVLVGESAAADLLVVGTRGHGGVAGLLLGSVSMHCAERAHCAVLVTRQPVAAAHAVPLASADAVPA